MSFNEPSLPEMSLFLVIAELKGLRNRSVSPTHQDESNVQKVVSEATRSLEILQTTNMPNCRMLRCDGTVSALDLYYTETFEGVKPNNDRLIIEATRRFSESVCARSIAIPRGDVWVYRDVLLVTRDRIMYVHQALPL